ncbi:MAG: hypothetical protein ACRC7N_20430 [Clostridium sp.]
MREKRNRRNVHPLNYDLCCDYVNSNLAVNFYKEVPRYVGYELNEQADLSPITLYNQMNFEEPIDEENIKLTDIIKVINKYRK